MHITRIRSGKLIGGRRGLVVLTIVFSLAAISSGCAQKPDASIQEQIQTMLSEKYAAYKAEAGLPENAGILVHLETPEGTYTAAAGLPPEADETWHYRIASVSKTFTAASIMLLDQ
jgi:D-alanyl-D-alanine carboxypeptidase